MCLIKFHQNQLWKQMMTGSWRSDHYDLWMMEFCCTVCYRIHNRSGQSTRIILCCMRSRLCSEWPNGWLKNPDWQSQNWMSEPLVHLQWEDECRVLGTSSVKLGHPVWRFRRRWRSDGKTLLHVIKIRICSKRCSSYFLGSAKNVAVWEMECT